MSVFPVNVESPSLYGLMMIDPEHIEAHWPEASQYIERTYELFTPPNQIEQDYLSVLDGTKQLFGVLDIHNTEFVAWGLTQVWTTSAGITVMGVGTLAGHGLAKWRGLWDDLEEFARFLGVSVIRVHGRFGWMKELRNKGFKHDHSVFVKELT